MILYEANNFGKHNMFRNFDSHNLNFVFHMHHSFECIYVEKGSMAAIVNNQRYVLCENDFLLILPNEIHSYDSPESCDCNLSIFSPDYVSAFYSLCKHKALENPVFRIDSCIRNYIFEALKNKSVQAIQIKACLYLLCCESLKNSALLESSRADYDLLHNILTYIQDNYKEDISLQKIAKKFGYDYSYLSRYLNKFLSISFTDLVNEYRINYAVELLKRDNKKITEIAQLCGYENVRTFNRNFVRFYKMTPKEFRAKE